MFDRKENADDDERAEAPFGGIGLHGGFTYTMLPWMHLGADAQAMFLASVNGFPGPGNNGFVMLSPGLRVRIVFGNLG